jgi:serine phosphatase RsbU (regulator of sigma subunit)
VKDRGRWLAPCIVFAAAAGWLAWAYPRLSPAARLGLKSDHDGYIAEARRLASRQGFDLTGWDGFGKVETLPKNQDLHFRMPGNAMALAFPSAQVETLFRRKGSGTAKVTLRPDGRPLSWKLTGAPATAASTHNDTAMAHKAMETMTGDEVSNYTITSDGAPGSDGMSFQWRRNAAGPEKPMTGITISVKNGAVGQGETTFTFPESVSRQFNSFPATRVATNTIWFILVALALAFPIFRDGGKTTARAMKDRTAILIGVAGGVLSALDNLTQWDAMVFSFSSGTAVTILMVILAALMMGALFYVTSAIAILNARLQPLPLRGFRLLGTRAFFSKVVGAEALGGLLFAPLIIAVPLLVSALTRLPTYKSYDDDFILSAIPQINGLLDVFGPETLKMIILFGVLVPLALRFFRPGAKRNVFFAVVAFLTLTTEDWTFRSGNTPNLICAALDGAAMYWLWSRFGLVGAVSGRCAAQLLTATCVLLVQPGHALQASGWGLLLEFGMIGLVILGTAAKGPEVVPELYGESNAQVQARSRREELLAEFNVARSAQQRMLPSEPPVIEGYSLAASCEPAREVGGDLYDFPRMSDGRWGIAVADVSGKGVPAALYMTLTKGLLCAASQEAADPRWILSAVNRHLKSVTKRKMFVTMAFAVLDAEARTMDYVRAGHNPVVWRRASAGETRLLAGAGIGLGIAAPALFGKTLAIETLDLAAGDALVFYSDGLTEAMNAGLEQYGEERLMAAVEKADGMHALAARDSILKDVRGFLDGVHAQDDLTIAVLRVNADTGR